MALFTNFGVRGNVGILDWYTISIRVFSLVVLSAHGASYLVLKTSGPVQRPERGRGARGCGGRLSYCW